MIEIKRRQQHITPTPTERAQKPIESLAEEQATYTTANTQNAQKRNLKPFKAVDGKDYRAAYRAACDFHERHNPPTISNDGGVLYWQEVTDDMQGIAQQFGNDPFIFSLLCAVFEELEREYKQLKNINQYK